MNIKRIKNAKDAVVVMAKAPAGTWDEAFPIGNGFKGAMIYGGVDKETLSLNDDTLWSGFPMDNFRGKGIESYKKIKELVRNKKYHEADSEASENFSCYACQTYMPLGDLVIEFDCKSKATRYKRTLDLERAVFNTKYYKDGVKYETEAFASNPANAIVYKIVTTKNGEKANELSFKAKLISKLFSRSYTQGRTLCLESEAPATSEQNINCTDRKTLYYDQPELRGMRTLTKAIIDTDGKVIRRDDFIEVKNASFVEIRIADATSFNGYKKHPFLDGRDYKAECEKILENIKDFSYERLREEHVKDYSKYFNRVAIDLGSSGKENVDTGERLVAYSKGQEDKALVALLFNFGRYLTIASSRKGSQPANLQGIWNKDFFAICHADYHLNINAQMNYFPTLIVGLEEEYEPLLRMIEEVAKEGVETAKKLYGAEGWCCHHNVDLWRYTQPTPGAAEWSYWNLGGGWLCQHLMEYYEYTLDKKYLKEKILPIFAGAVKFYLCVLEELDGYKMLLSSTSPENSFTYDGKKSAVAETTEMSMAIVRELFGNYVKACEILGEDGDLLKRVKEEIPKLLPICVGKDGRVLEWYGEKEEREINHRHISHAYSLFPGNAVTLEKTPQLAEAIEKSIATRGENSGMGWTLSWKSCCYSRLRDGETAFKFIKKQMIPKMENGKYNLNYFGTYPNMTNACPPFQIDGSFGGTRAVLEMLMQSEVDQLHIAPALPKEIENVDVKGIKAKGKRTVTFVVENGDVVYCKIVGSKPEKITVKGIDKTEKFVQIKGGWIYNK